MRICCVIVTFNRSQLLMRCIHKCLEQSCNPDILVYDNASTDDTYDRMLNNGYMNHERIFYYRSNENLGGAGGFSNGLRMAYEKGYNYVWLMDDDGYPRNEDTLLECISVCSKYENKAIVNAFVYAENNMLSFTLGGCESTEEVDKKFNNDVIENYLAPFNGTLIPSLIIERIGFPRADFFIKGDEFEYVTRAKMNGYNLLTARKACFYHPRFVIQKRRFLWKTIPMNDEPAWKEYCRARNHAYINRKYYGKIKLIRHYLVEMIRCLYFETDVSNKRKAVITGLKDERAGIFLNSKVKEFW